MLGNRPITAPLRGVLTRLRDWPVSAQQQARRNAMVAATLCAQRRIEREEVADYLQARAGSTPRTVASTDASGHPGGTGHPDGPTARAHG